MSRFILRCSVLQACSWAAMAGNGRVELTGQFETAFSAASQVVELEMSTGFCSFTLHT